MNKIYDKLLLVIALLALLAGVAFYVTKSGDTPSGATQVSTQTADNPYRAIPVSSSSVDQANWPEAGEQPSGWVYDVFTPPKIFLEPDGTFTIVEWMPKDPPPPFGIYLATMENDPYRIQVEGYIEEQDNSLILFYDEELKKSVRARIGDEVEASSFKVLDFSIERVVDPSEGIFKIATAKIMDLRENIEYTLVHGERLMREEVTIIVKSKQDPSVEVTLAEAGQTFETSLGQYVLQEINLEESSITVEKQALDEFDAEVKVLTLTASETNTTPETPIVEPTEPDEDLSNFFN